MRKEFSTSWKASSQPRKQRKYLANAPLHLKRKKLTANLSKELKVKEKARNMIIRKNDKVKIMRGSHKGKTGKIIEVLTKIGKVVIEGIQTKKQDGSKANLKLQPSNLQIIELTERNNKAVSKKTEEKESNKKAVKEIKIGAKKE